MNLLFQLLGNLRNLVFMLGNIHAGERVGGKKPRGESGVVPGTPTFGLYLFSH